MGRKPILIQDDGPVVRKSIGWLKDAGYQVVTAESDEEALCLTREQDFSVILLDIRWPGKNGLAALKEIKLVKPQGKFIVMTAYPSPEVAVEAMKLGAIDYLVKPIAPNYLEGIIRKTLLQCQSEQ